MYKYLSILFAITISAQTISDNRFIGYDASSMAGSVVATSGTIDGILNNPSSLAELKLNTVSFGGGNLYGLPWLPNYNFLLFFKFPVLGSIGFGYQDLSVSYMDTELSKENSLIISNGRFIYNDMNSTLSIGWSLNRMSWLTSASAGISGNGSDGIGSQEMSVYGINAGFQATLRNKYRMGVFLKNINSPIIGSGLSQQELLRRLDIGIAYIPIPDVTTSLSISQQLGLSNMIVSGGFKYSISKFFIIQLGAQTNPNRLGLGFQSTLGKVSFLYSFLSHPILPSTNQFSMRYNF
mgnify:CR=1 FL=1